jgi:aminopeptidase N
MRKLLLITLVLVALAASAQRLPEIAVPSDYQLLFEPDFSTDTFRGETVIDVRVLKSSASITLNAAELKIQKATIKAGNTTQDAVVTSQPQKEMVVLTVPKPLAAGPARIAIQYTGTLNDELRGLYLSKAAGRKYAATQFEATDARRAFPSFDEPAYKARFTVTVIAPKDDMVISNTAVTSDAPGPGSDKHTVKFAPTAKMSSYLVALAVGKFGCLEGAADGIPIRVCATPEKKELGAFALEAAQQVMKFFNRYYSIKYPFGKLDLVGLADFGPGAMENTGAITFRESLLLLDPKTASARAKKNITSVIAHEMAHQWFGDTVTAQWWDDIWLNEGFATWMQSKPVQAWKPEWNIDLDDAGFSGDALNLDALASTRPIHAASTEAQTPAEIAQLFDGIAYGKTAAVLRMLEGYVRPEQFRAGVNAFIEGHAYGNATSPDFWNALAKATKKPVDKIMPTFVNQAGAPLISVSSKCEGNRTSVTLSQQRFFYDRALLEKGSDELWMVPVCLKNPGGAPRCELLSQRQKTIQVDGCQPVFANAGAQGYYRSAYDPEAVRAMARNVNAFTPAERIVLVGDEWALVRAGRYRIGDYLNLAQAFQSDRTAPLWQQISGQLDFIGDYLVSDTSQDGYRAWVRGLLKPLAADLGWEPAPNEPEDVKALRPAIFNTLGTIGADPQVLSHARQLAQQYMKDDTAIDPSMANVVVNLAAFNGDASLYEQFVAQTGETRNPQKYYLFFYALASFRDPSLLKRTLEMTLAPGFRTQDMFVIGAVLDNPFGRRIGWDFLRAHWGDIAKRVPATTLPYFVQMTSPFCDAGSRDQAQQFFTEHKVPGADRPLRQTLERINNCIELKSLQSENLSAWLKQQGTKEASR